MGTIQIDPYDRSEERREGTNHWKPKIARGVATGIPRQDREQRTKIDRVHLAGRGHAEEYVGTTCSDDSVYDERLCEMRGTDGEER